MICTVESTAWAAAGPYEYGGVNRVKMHYE